MNRYVTVDDMTVIASHSEGVKNLVADLFVVAQLEVETLLLFIRSLVGKEVALKSCHLRLVEQRRVHTTPQIQEVVAGIEPQLPVRIVLKGSTDHHANVVHQLMSAVTLTFIQLNLLQAAVLVQRTRSVEQQVLVADAIHASMRQQHLDVLL